MAEAYGSQHFTAKGLFSQLSSVVLDLIRIVCSELRREQGAE